MARLRRHFLRWRGVVIFVFGSNLAGRHGKGAALTALRFYGAQIGQGVGRHGNSYAIPTKDERLNTLALNQIKGYVSGFLGHARANPDTAFLVTRVGCGLAGYKDEDIAPMFAKAPPNCFFDPRWGEIIMQVVRSTL